MNISRRTMLVGTTALVAGCTNATAVNSNVTEITQIAAVLSDLAPQLLSLTGLSAGAQTTITNALKLIPSAASAIAAAVTPTTTDLATFFSSATTLVNLVAGLVPGGSDVATAIESVIALLPSLASAFGLSLAASDDAPPLLPPAKVSVTVAKANLAALYAKKHGS